MQPQKRQPLRVTRRWRRRLAIALAALVLGIAFHKVYDYVHVWSMAESTARRFTEEPTQQRVNQLVKALEYGVFSRERGNEVFAMIMKPRLVKRAMYVEDRPVNIGQETWRYEWVDHSLATRQWRTNWEGKIVQEGALRGVQGGYYYWSLGKRWYQFGWGLDENLTITQNAPKAGEYIDTFEYRFKLIPIHKSYKWGAAPYWRIFPLNLMPFHPMRVQGTMADAAIYECTYTIPISWTVVTAEEERQLDLVSDPQTDAAMKAALTLDPFARGTGRLPAGSAANEWMLRGKRLPANALFTVLFRDAAGKDWPLEIHPPRALAAGGEDFTIIPAPQDIRKQPPGEYPYTLILKSGRAGSDYEPVFNSVWQGELEFPVVLKVEPDAK